jgi:hypothetical protein
MRSGGQNKRRHDELSLHVTNPFPKPAREERFFERFLVSYDFVMRRSHSASFRPHHHQLVSHLPPRASRLYLWLNRSTCIETGNKPP